MPVKYLKWFWPDSKGWKEVVVGVWVLIIGGIGAILYALFPSLFGALASNAWEVPYVLKAGVTIPYGVLILLLSLTTVAITHLCLTFRKPVWVRKYTSDVINDVLWKWSYDGQYRVRNLKPFCRRCGTAVDITTGVDQQNGNRPFTQIYCPNCNNAFQITGTNKLVESHILPKIDRQISSGEWNWPRIDGGTF